MQQTASVKPRAMTKSLCLFLSGPSVNKAVLLQLQQAKAKELEMRNNMRQVYDNLSYDDNEMKRETQAATNDSRPSKVIENQKEERIDHF